VEEERATRGRLSLFVCGSPHQLDVIKKRVFVDAFTMSLNKDSSGTVLVWGAYSHFMAFVMNTHSSIVVLRARMCGDVVQSQAALWPAAVARPPPRMSGGKPPSALSAKRRRSEAAAASRVAKARALRAARQQASMGVAPAPMAAPAPLPSPPPAPQNTHAATFEAAARKLVAEDSTVASILQAINDISERLEIVHTSEYGNFLRYLFPAFASLLSGAKVPPMFEECDAHSVRNTVLEILNRLVRPDTRGLPLATRHHFAQSFHVHRLAAFSTRLCCVVPSLTFVYCPLCGVVRLGVAWRGMAA